MQERNIMEILRDEHRDLESYVKDIERASSGIEIQSLLKKTKECAKDHFQTEGTQIYAKCLEKKDATLDGLVKRGKREQTEITGLIDQMESIETKGTPWKEKVRDLKSKVESYSSREEREFIPELRKHFDEKQMIKLAADYLLNEPGVIGVAA